MPRKRIHFRLLISTFVLLRNYGKINSGMAQMTTSVSKLLERALSLSIDEQEALAESLISSLGEKVDPGVQAAWNAEIEKRVAELDSGRAKTVPWTEVRKRNLAKLPRNH
jgi:putative addiction module component (TIGR02574 family)